MGPFASLSLTFLLVRYLFRETDTLVTDDVQTGWQQRERVVTTMSLTAPDQLRQRMAWALSQILVINKEASANGLTDAFLRYYDILVRHAFGNYFDMLKEVAFTPQMGSFLTYQGSASYYFNRNQFGKVFVIFCCSIRYLAISVTSAFEVPVGDTSTPPRLSMHALKTLLRAPLPTRVRTYTQTRTSRERSNSSSPLVCGV